jgi:hypothetical protein
MIYACQWENLPCVMNGAELSSIQVSVMKYKGETKYSVGNGKFEN